MRESVKNRKVSRIAEVKKSPEAPAPSSRQARFTMDPYELEKRSFIKEMLAEPVSGVFII